MIQLENINLSFSNKKILNNLNLTIQKDENVCLTAPSGKGKTTLLNLLQGYVIPDSGKIYINGVPLSQKTILIIRNQISCIPQNINLPVENGVELMEIMNLKSNIKGVDKYLQKLGLESKILYKNFDKISGGQKQRVVISICLSLEKPIILLDEPTSSLDDKSIELLVQTVKALKGRTIVSASHNQLWASNADKIIEL